MRKYAGSSRNIKESELPQGLSVKKWLKGVVLATPKRRKASLTVQGKESECSAVQTTCRQITREARRSGRSSFRKAHNLLCEPNFTIHSLATPNDTYYSLQWGLNQSSDIDIDAPEAWNISTGSNSVVVGVIDTGIQTNHPDLAANIWVNPNEVPGNGIDDDFNGYIDDVNGLNAILDNGNLIDDNGHGTHCAGVIGGSTNNGVGIAGINWNVKLLGCRFLGTSGSGSTSDAIQCIQYMTDLKMNGVNIVVLSNSWGSTGYSSSLLTAIQDAANVGIISVAAAGNEGRNNDGATKNYPASYDDPSIISVAALASDGTLPSWSNYGVASVDLAAPGDTIASTVNGSGYVYMSGTSMATPHVAGAIALLKAQFPGLSVSQERDLVLQTTAPLGALTGKVATGGLLNLYSMLLAAQTVTTTTSSTTTTSTTSTTTFTSSTSTTSTSSTTSTTSGPAPTTTTTISSTTTTTQAPASDTQKPTVLASNASGKANRSATLTYRVNDNSGFSSDKITVKVGTKTVKQYSVKKLPIPASRSRLVQISTQSLSRRTYQYCVTSTDPDGNQSAQSCAKLSLR